MSKNLTRKGLAFGALVALGSSVIAGAPAFAAGELNLQPSTGTTYGTIIGETFTLSANTNPGYASSEAAKLKFNVTNASKAALTIATNAGANGAGVVNAGAADNSNYVVTTQAPSTTDANTIKIATAATATSSVGVQAWIDSDFDSVIDAGEWTSATQTVTFNKASEVTWNTEFTAPQIGDTKFVSYVSASPSINVAQIAAKVSILFSQTTNSKFQVKALAAGNYDATTGKLKFNDNFSLDTASPSAPETAVLAGKRYTAQAAYDVTGTEDSADVVGTAVAYAVAAATITDIADPATANSDNTLYTDSTSPALAVTVRDTATSIPVEMLVSDANGALKNTAVTVYLEEGAAGGTDTNATTAVGNYDSSTFAAGGVTLQDTSATAQKVSFTATSNADGKVVFNITAAAKKNDSIKVWASAQGVNATPTKYTVYTFDSAAPSSVKNNNVQGNGAVLKQAAGSTFALNFTVVDQFGAAIPTADKYRVAITDGADYSTGTQYFPGVSAGKASQSIILASNATSKTYKFKVQTKGTDGNYTDAGVAGTDLSVVVGASNAAASFTAVADLTVGGTVAQTLSSTETNALTVAGTRTAKLDTVAFVAGDKNAGTANAVKGTTTTGFNVGGTVTDATTAATYSTVTLSGANLNFVANGTLYSAGSVTVQTDASGVYGGVTVLSNKSGKQTLTITAGSVSKSYVVDFGPAAATAGKTLTVDAPATILPGRTLVVSAKLVDKFGNGVDVAATHAKVAYDGPGLIVGDLPTQTDENGALSFRVLLGASDTGSATVTVKVSTDADTTFDETDDLSVAKTITIGAAPVVATAAASGSTGKFFASVTNAAGKKVVVKVSGKFVTSFTGTLAKKSVAVAALKGNRTVTIYVGGQLVLTKLVTIK